MTKTGLAEFTIAIALLAPAAAHAQSASEQKKDEAPKASPAAKEPGSAASEAEVSTLAEARELLNKLAKLNALQKKDGFIVIKPSVVDSLQSLGTIKNVKSKTSSVCD